MRQVFAVEMDDGTTYRIESDGRDIRAWEAEYATSWLSAGLSFTNMTQLAYIAGRRTGVLNGAWPTYGVFDAHCVDARGERRKPLIGDPTRPAPTAGSSASSLPDSDVSRPRSKPKGRRLSPPSSTS